MLALTIIWQCI